VAVTRVEIEGSKIVLITDAGRLVRRRTTPLTLGRRSKMRVRLRGINSRTKILASGETVTYYYAWKGGPRLDGEFGSAEFIASFHAAVTARKTPRPNTLLSLLQGYQASDDFLSRAPRTRTDYVKQIMLIEGQFGDSRLVLLVILVRVGSS
jgi:hypothetical protein